MPSLQDEITQILSLPDLTPAQQSAAIAALVMPSMVTPAPNALTTQGHPTVGGIAVLIDPVVPTGTSGTVTMPVTGHVLSLPKPSQGEGLMGYFQRTSLQTGGNPGDAGALIITAQGIADKFQMDAANASSWPSIVDYLANTTVYMNAMEPGFVAAGAAQDAKIAAEDHGTGTMDINSFTANDLMYIAAVAKTASYQVYAKLTNGTVQDITNVINESAGNLSGTYSAFDPTTYTSPNKAAIDAAIAATKHVKPEPHA